MVALACPAVTVSKRERQRQNREARRAAEEAARRRTARRRQLITVVLIGALVGGVTLLISALRSSNPKGTASGKECVPVADALPPGAPEVPVKTGPAPTTLIKDDLKEGTGAEVAPGSTVTVNYIGVTCTTGKVFDSSYSRGKPASFSLDGVIKGWTDGIPGMKVGGRRLLGIPADQAYGAQGSPSGGIGPDEPLWFVVEVVDTTPAATGAQRSSPPPSSPPPSSAP